MMFNVPIPDGTTAHAVGAVIIAIVLGPWAAVIAVSVALLFQALLFGDGGVLAYGANVVNMAILMPFVGYAGYRLIAGRSALTATRRVVAAGLAGFVGINAAGLATAIELGIQPDLFHTAAGAPLYSPYHLSQSIPAMALAHVIVAGPVEAVLTAGVFGSSCRPTHRPSPRRTRASPANRAPRPPAAPRVCSAPRGWPWVSSSCSPRSLRLACSLRGAPSVRTLRTICRSLILAWTPYRPGWSATRASWSHTLLGDYGFADGQNATLAYWVCAVLGIAIVGIAVYAAGRLFVWTTRGRGGRTPVQVHS